MCKTIGRGWRIGSQGTALKFCFLVVQLMLQSSVLRGAETQSAAVSIWAALRTVRRNWTPATTSMHDYQRLFVKCDSRRKIISVSICHKYISLAKSRVHLEFQLQGSLGNIVLFLLELVIQGVAIDIKY